MKKLLLLFVACFALAACTTKVSPMTAVVEQVQTQARQSATTARTAAQQTQDAQAAAALKECAEALEDCAVGADSVARSANAEKQEAARQAWNRGFMWGFGTAFGIIMLLAAFGFLITKKE